MATRVARAIRLRVGRIRAALRPVPPSEPDAAAPPGPAPGSVPGELFASAAPYYARYRPGYPEDLFDTLAGRLGFDGSQLVADIGCGPGRAAIPLARRVRQVVAIDPAPQMLAAGERAAVAAGVTNIIWRLGDSTRLGELGVAGAHAAVFAASWHWMDRPRVAAALDELLDPAGALVIIDGCDDEEDHDWVRAIAEIRARYLGPVRRAGSGIYVPPQGRHRDLLLASPFAAAERLVYRWERRLTVDEAVGLQFSYSYSTPAMFGRRAEAFAADVRGALLALYPRGVVPDRLGVELLIAHRS